MGVLVDYPHPRSSSNNRVFEHILVMEEAIGRFLTNNGVVHHRDGNKQNNDISNLELFSRNAERMRRHRRLSDQNCPKCGSRYIHKTGLNTSGEQRLQCTDCYMSFTDRSID